MKNIRVLLLLLVVIAFLPSCRKNHYDVSHVQGVNTQGELLLPIGTKSFTVRDMMESFEMADMLNWTEDGDMSYVFGYEIDSIINGEDLLRFDDQNYEWHTALVNPFPTGLPLVLDTVLSIRQHITFQSENIRVMQGWMKSGRFDFIVSSNIGDLQRVVLRSSNIKDEQGNDFVFDAPAYGDSFGFDIAGARYVTEEANTLDFDIEMHFRLVGTTDPELALDVNLAGRDLACREMYGYVETYESRSRIDTTFALFPSQLTGTLKVDGVRVRVSERNTFGINACLVVDTALIINEGQQPYSVFSQMPLIVDIPSQSEFGEVVNWTVNGKVDVSGGRIFSTSSFIVNQGGMSELVSVDDASRIDAKIDVEVPFSFIFDDIFYMDTVDLNLSQLELPDLIESLTMELAFSSTLPVNLKASFYAYDSSTGRITDTLLDNAQIIEAAVGNQPTTTEVAIVIDDEKMENVMHSDRILISYMLDSGNQSVSLNGNQAVELFMKVRAKYNVIVEL